MLNLQDVSYLVRSTHGKACITMMDTGFNHVNVEIHYNICDSETSAIDRLLLGLVAGCRQWCITKEGYFYDCGDELAVMIVEDK